MPQKLKLIVIIMSIGLIAITLVILLHAGQDIPPQASIDRSRSSTIASHKDSLPQYIAQDRARALEIANSLDLVEMLSNKTSLRVFGYIPYSVSKRTAKGIIASELIGWCIIYRLSRPVWIDNVSYRTPGQNVSERFTGWARDVAVCVPTHLDNPREKIAMAFTPACLPGIPLNASNAVKTLVAKAFNASTAFLTRLGYSVAEKHFCYIDSKYVHIELITSRGDRYVIMVDKDTMEIKYSSGELRQFPERP